MSKYSTELRYVINSGYDLGLKEYEVFSEEYRAKLNKKILDHYYFHEIGFETVGRFKHYLNSTMNEIMPYYNKLLQSELLEINPLLSFERNISSTKGVDSTITEDIDNLNTKISEVLGNQTLETSTLLDSATSNEGHDEQVGSNTRVKDKTNLNNSSESDVFYDTPSASLGDIETSNYATTLTKKVGDNALDELENESSNENITNDSTSSSTTLSGSEGTSISNSKDDINETVTGKTDISKVGNINETNIITENGFEIPLSDLLMKYRDTFLNIDKLIINELKDLFMMVY